LSTAEREWQEMKSECRLNKDEFMELGGCEDMYRVSETSVYDQSDCLPSPWWVEVD